LSAPRLTVCEQRRAAEASKKSAHSRVWRNVEETVKTGELDSCENDGNENESARDTEICTKMNNSGTKMCQSIAGVDGHILSAADMRERDGEGEGEGENSTIDYNSYTDSGSDTDISDKPNTHTDTNKYNTHNHDNSSIAGNFNGKEDIDALSDAVSSSISTNANMNTDPNTDPNTDTNTNISSNRMLESPTPTPSTISHTNGTSTSSSSSSSSSNGNTSSNTDRDKAAAFPAKLVAHL
jgi:hypothetical protein